ncbi:aminotransferase class I/II-fold pyridoxal phosphate-dependent enzyme [Salsipaludibacter albus]|uniref:aminotransferase class I/II-fold pyridoxal phosphate-dependent enzyme n=1 Tax=Salsipaludibacter albus TaxID=2849650 RepID=UPI001EE3F728|nr:aminotransferase class I/II-fold pyridoxal phosphate-dependent enzyme [Salsipaludibacter albus]MBY5161517.1 aminotransferase class I/II-fold pyridoxal phosphate-dependent enzyme [Salsipaludibacter albus]
MTTPGPSTKSVHLTEEVDPTTRSVVPPIVANSAFAYPDVASWRAVALGEAEGHIYARNSNPTTDHFEAKVAALEEAEAGTSFGTGMAAIFTTLQALLRPGDRVVTVKDTYGGTYLLFTEILPAWGVECDVLDTDDHEAIEEQVRAGCDLLYLESPTNPTCKVLDLQRLAGAAAEVGAVTVVDNTFATPINTRPVTLGADVVLHSASKFLGGHGDVLGGVAVGSKALVERIYGLREIIGTGMDPQVAALMLRSLKTLGLRVERQNETALAVAQHLATHPKVTAVNYPGLPTHPHHDVATRQMDGFGGMLSFAVEGGFPAVETVLGNLRYAYLAANLGQVETIAGPPATTSHVELTDDERAIAGIPEGLVRYSVGIEDAADLLADLDQALAAV